MLNASSLWYKVSGITKGIKKFCHNTGNFAKIQGKHREFHNYEEQGYSDFRQKNWMCLPSQFCMWNIVKLLKLSKGNFAVRQGRNKENTGNLKTRFWVGTLSLLIHEEEITMVCGSRRGALFPVEYRVMLIWRWFLLCWKDQLPVGGVSMYSQWSRRNS